MYGVFSFKRVILGFAILLVSLFMLLGVAGRTICTSARERQLPIYSVETGGRKLAALGINCAWDDSDINEILTLLDRRHVKATFFLVGDWCEKYPDAVKRLAAAGHELGSHSDTHPDMTKLSREEIEKQLSDSKRKIESISGQKIHLFRAPSGAYNDLVVSTARACRWEVIQWSNEVDATASKTDGARAERMFGWISDGLIYDEKKADANPGARCVI